MYETPNDATSRFKEVEYTKGTVDDIFIDKGWNHLALQNKYILLITGDCSYSEDDWAKVTTTLDKELKKMFNRITRLVNCRCGGGCS